MARVKRKINRLPVGKWPEITVNFNLIYPYLNDKIDLSASDIHELICETGKASHVNRVKA